MGLHFFRPNAAVRLGDSVAQDLMAASPKPGKRERAADIQLFLQRVDEQARPLKLGWLGRARLTNAFKWRLREVGIEQSLADELTHILLMHLVRPASVAGEPPPARPN